MPPARSLTRRRRSSLAMGLLQVKPGNYGIAHTLSPRALTFAPNVTPGTYVEAEEDLSGDSPHSPSAAIFPPTAPQTAAPSRRRCPPGKRLSQGYIPRPPNAFMLFRANFVRQKHVPGSIETNHGSLSKIIGNCWRALPLDEKKYWELEAKREKAAHRERWPTYRFRPVHNKKKKAGTAATKATASGSTNGRRKDKLPTLPAEEERCEAVAHFLLEGKKGEELAEAVRQLDMARAMSRPESASSDFDISPWSQPSAPAYLQRRPSSVPPPSTLFHPGHPITLPTIPFFAAPAPQMAFPGSNPMFNPGGFAVGSNSAHGSRAPSPVSNISRNRAYLGLRRASSVQPVPSERMWDDYNGFSAQPQYGAPVASWQLQPDDEPLPDVTDAIFQPGWTSSFKDEAPSADYAQVDPRAASYSPHELSLNIGPLDSFDFASASGPSTATDGYSAGAYESLDPHAPWPLAESGPSSAFSGSPARSDASLPHVVSSQTSGICAPQPQHAQMQFDAWASAEQDVASQHQPVEHTPVPEDAERQFSALVMEFEKSYQGGDYEMYGAVDTTEFDMALDASAVDYGFCHAPQEF
ncbi:uncharacterized protein TRAVEDRAFT_153013 [Trametes versicolor FP-101664 SS1]|uniref:uncharacterized protein n=1 Tax=Trametes versicolor (strain FP-101664) TaxID=717944 RepID=UPI0004624140|nr:uncharacterized protein TRAVEDRAFT_153013 [Trametes versicolor FP-101664 SS1]EIW54723.1 hypothetical protein TRAVEDRAFT_153013 [Trametes versicolor FP-101664 SS1]